MGWNESWEAASCEANGKSPQLSLPAVLQVLHTVALSDLGKAPVSHSEATIVLAPVVTPALGGNTLSSSLSLSDGVGTPPLRASVCQMGIMGC